MGVVVRQSVKTSVLGYFGVILGAINILFIYEYCLTVEELGRMKFILDTAFIFSPLIALGAKPTLIRFFPILSKKGDVSNLLFLLLAYLLIGFFIFHVIIGILFKDLLPTKLEEYYFHILIVSLLIATSGIFGTFSHIHKRTVVPYFANNLWYKIGLPIIVVFYYFRIINFQELEIYIILSFIPPLILLYLFLKRIMRINPSIRVDYLDKTIMKEMAPYALFNVINAVSAVMLLYIDKFMVTEILSFEKGGIYTVAVYFVGLLSIPATASYSILNPIISKHSTEKNNTAISLIYKQTSILFFIFGFGLLLVLWFNLDFLFSLMSKGAIYSSGKNIILIVGLAKLFDLLTSINNHIMTHSQYYKINVLFIIILSILNIVLNILFIEKYGMIGAAYASFIAIVLINSMRLIFVWRKMDMQPFSTNTLKTILFGITVWSLLSIITNEVKISIWSSVLLTTIIFLLYTSGIYYMKVSKEFNNLIEQYKSRIKLF